MWIALYISFTILMFFGVAWCLIQSGITLADASDIYREKKYLYASGWTGYNKMNSAYQKKMIIGILYGVAAFLSLTITIYFATSGGNIQQCQ